MVNVTSRDSARFERLVMAIETTDREQIKLSFAKMDRTPFTVYPKPEAVFEAAKLLFDEKVEEADELAFNLLQRFQLSPPEFVSYCIIKAADPVTRWGRALSFLESARWCVVAEKTHEIQPCCTLQGLSPEARKALKNLLFSGEVDKDIKVEARSLKRYLSEDRSSL